MRVLIVGLPLFAERLSLALSEYDPDSRFVHLDTYYSKRDKLRALWQIRRADCVVSINGSITSSRVFDMTLKRKVPLIMNWVGTDVIKSTKAFKEGNFEQEYIDQATHFCEVGWIQDELAEIGINAEIVNFAVFKKSFDLKPISNKKLTVLSYISHRRSDFYGMRTLIRMAEQFPSMNFLIAGTDAAEYQPLPANLKALGWVNKMDEIFDQTHVCVRFTEHDGLSNFILESLARGKQVAYKNEFNHCFHCPDEAHLASTLLELETKLKNGDDLINAEGAEFIQEEFNETVILGTFLEKIKAVIGEK